MVYVPPAVADIAKTAHETIPVTALKFMVCSLFSNEIDRPERNRILKLSTGSVLWGEEPIQGQNVEFSIKKGHLSGGGVQCTVFGVFWGNWI